jgi:hypothetical protein
MMLRHPQKSAAATLMRRKVLAFMANSVLVELPNTSNSMPRDQQQYVTNVTNQTGSRFGMTLQSQSVHKEASH